MDKIKLIECVPNISEGRSLSTLDAISELITQENGAALLHRDMGYDAHRTVFTIVGEVSAVLRVMDKVYSYCFEHIAMQYHRGTHPRIGAVDVCPFIPLKNISHQNLVTQVKEFASRIGQKYKIPVYLYEGSALHKGRQKLEKTRKGEYEGLPEKLKDEKWKPDFGPAVFNPAFGATVIGVRKFLLAYNINLATKKVEVAKEIAARIRSSGRRKKMNSHKIIRYPGDFAEVKAIGWYVEEYGCVQVSTNLTDYTITNMAEVYERCSQYARELGTEVTGSELIGLIPEEAIVKAGQHYTQAKSKEKKIQAAIKYLGLSSINAFKPEERILEWAYKGKNNI